MTLSKRERVLKTLELNGEPDLVPIHTLGFEPSGKSFQVYLNSKEKEQCETKIRIPSIKKRFNITEQVFWDVDMHTLDPFGKKLLGRNKNAPKKYSSDHVIDPMNGKIYKAVEQVDTGLAYFWYIEGYFTSPEIVDEYWAKYGKPSEKINDNINYSSRIWENFVKEVSPYFYPIGEIPLSIHESVFEGITMARVAYYMRKNPQFIHRVVKEYTKTIIEVIKRYGEAGVDIVLYYDDLGYKERTILSKKNFQEFILPYYKKVYKTCKKQGILIIQHSCGKIDDFLPDLIQAGLNGIQALEPAAGVNLKHLKETYGDKICFLGGMDSSRILNFGSPKEIDKHVAECINIAGKGGGYFAGPSHNIIHAPWKNLITFRESLEKHRTYPLN
ncbi:MAG: hypothetical protein GF317_19850 [Candidatus Lokiarchaeota archaeon]|nr:hypothetical protein [Candidatus Lokiarchaeota archaeon]MBD3201747.1 hypothetical protein [Candidatus Lokiarchaeota archaeon]